MAPRIRWIQAAVVAVLVALVGGRWLVVSTAGRLWAEALGVGATHGGIRQLQTALLATAFVAAAVWCLGNLYLVYRSIGSVHVPRRLGDLEILEAIPRQYLLVAAAGLGLILAIALSHRADGWWYARALTRFDVPVGTVDPLLGRDLGFYLYQLPWYRTLHSFATLLSGVMLAITAVLYAAVGAIRWAKRRLHVTYMARWHLAGLLVAFALALFWGYRLEPVEYVAGIHDVPADTVLTGVRIPVARMLSALALVVASASLIWMWTARPAVVIVPWALLAVASFAGHYVVPAFAGAVRTPEELRHTAVEERRREFLQAAHGAVPEEVAIQALASSEPRAVARHQPELEPAPLWDAFAVRVFLDRVADPDPHARFLDPALDVYWTGDDRPVPVYVAARQLDLSAARQGGVDLSWDRVHAGPFTSATGAVAVLAHRVSSTGLPLFVPDLSRPDSAVSGVSELQLEHPEVLFGPGIVNFAVVAPGDRGTVGVPAGGLFRRLALAWVLQSPQLVASDAVTDTALILWHREVAERLNRFAPFARFSGAHAVVIDRALYWVANGLVSAEAFPLSPAVRWRGEKVRYLRSSLVGVVAAATGSTTVYLTRDPDPVSAAWAQLAPEIVRPAAEIPSALAGHVRYPAELFATQIRLLKESWRSQPTGPETAALGQGLAGTASDRLAPYWWVGTAPHDSAARLRLMAAVETGEPPLLAAVVEGVVRRGAYSLALLKAEPPLELPGPTQMAVRFTRLRPDPTGVTGAVRTIPFADGVLSLQASYASPGDEHVAPQLAGVVVGWGGAAGTGATLRDALHNLQTQAPPSGVGAGQWAEARRWFEYMDAARRTGDWTAFGQAYERLRRLLTGMPDTVP